MKFPYILLLSLILVMGLASAEVQTLGVFKQGKCVELIQTCSNCTWINMSSVSYPNSTKLLLTTGMTQNGIEYNYSFCKTDALGQYIATTCGDVDGGLTCVSYDFEITYLGKKNTTAENTISIIVLIILILGLTTLIYTGKNLPSENVRTNEGELIKIEWKKYMKWGCWTFSYIIVIFIVYICWTLSKAYSNFDYLPNIFMMFYKIILGLSFPLMVFVVIYGSIKFLHERKLEEMLERGLSIR